MLFRSNSPSVQSGGFSSATAARAQARAEAARAQAEAAKDSPSHGLVRSGSGLIGRRRTKVSLLATARADLPRRCRVAMHRRSKRSRLLCRLCSCRRSRSQLLAALKRSRCHLSSPSSSQQRILGSRRRPVDRAFRGCPANRRRHRWDRPRADCRPSLVRRASQLARRRVRRVGPRSHRVVRSRRRCSCTPISLLRLMSHRRRRR